MTTSTGNVEQVHVVVYGFHSQDWINAFAPDGALWAGLPQVGRVSCIEADSDELERVTAGCPLRVIAIPLMENHADRLPPDVARFHPPKTLSDLLRDKKRTLDYAVAQGFAAWCPEVYEDVRQIKFPCIVKRVDLNASFGVEVAHSRRALETLLGAALEIPPNVVVQSFVYGAKEYATYLMLKDGDVIWDTTICYEMDFSDVVRRPGTAPARRIDTPDHIVEQLRAFLLPLRYSGLCNVDYKIRSNGEAAIFEVNPRLGGALMRPENVDLLRRAVALMLRHANRPD